MTTTAIRITVTTSSIVKPSIWHRTIDGSQLMLAREMAGLTQQEFAELCGWSQEHQSQLERPQEYEIHIHKAEKILQALGCD